MRLLVLLLTGYLLLTGLIDLVAASDAGLRRSLGVANDPSGLVAEGGLLAGASLLTLLLFRTGTGWIPGLRQLRQGAPITWLTLTLFTYSLAANLVPATAMATVAATTAAPERASDLILNGLPFALVAVASVGPGVRRTAAETLQRLGLLPLKPAWWGLGLAVGVLIVPGIDRLVPLLNHLSSADCLVQQGQVLQSLQGDMRSPWAQLGIALSAGICEELLFRGALQPRVGIVLSTILWASFHLQYTCHGFPQPPQLVIVLLGFVFGGLRRWGGLGAAVAAHVSYDASILLEAGPITQALLAMAGMAAAVGIGGVERRRRDGGRVP
jgi:membrane protease YdiL (CAAX protease family)